MTLKKILIGSLLFHSFLGCVSVVHEKPDFYDLEIEEFASSVELLLEDLDYLKQEILKVNAKKPSIQRILSEADSFWLKGDITKTNSELERALRISKEENALYLRLAHLRLEQGLKKESKAFASRGLLNKETSAWELLLLKIYSSKEND